MICRRSVPALCAVLALGGCMTTRATPLTTHPHPPVPEEEVRVYLARRAMPPACEPVVSIRVRGDVDLTTENQMIAAARRRAGRAGANALLVDQIRNPSTGTQVAAVLLGTPDPRRGRMIGFHCSPAEAAEEEAADGEEGAGAQAASGQAADRSL